MGGQPLRFITSDMEVGQEVVQQHQKGAAQYKPSAHRQQYAPSLGLSHLHGGDQQRPDGCRDHDPSGKA